ncbi:MAG: sulfite exporter TauE/SafE family protein [Burkholderiales bacterium]|nr:sulfite exporter TauE/SafE family protein [Burkholderiales bacterium]MDE2432174.1 sulfite exporter TauE/SafE family protein [Burkholderiales bacterium]
MLWGLILSAFLMGLSGAPHCAAMCGMPCAAALQRPVPLSALLGRLLGYVVLGAVVAASAGWVSQWSREVAFLKPFWLIAQAMAVLLGLWLLISGVIPRQLDDLGLDLYHQLRQRWGRATAGQGVSPWISRTAPVLAGMGWALLPCGLLYGAVVVAALAPTVWGGALVMAAFAIPSGVGVWLAPKLMRWLRGSNREHPQWAIRLSGLTLAGIAAWGLFHHLYAQWQAWCG